MNELALFSGAGGGILGGMLLGWRTVCAVEIEDYPRRVLLQRQADGILPRFPIWDDVCSFNGKPWRGKVDVISGGFPCQDISCAGKGAGLSGERSGLWSEFARIIDEVRPTYAFVENSPMLVGRGLTRVLSDLAEMGYDARWGVIGTYHVGGNCKGERVWIVASSSEVRRTEVVCCQNGIGEKKSNGRQTINAHPCSRIERIHALEEMVGQPCILGRNDGLAHRLDRLHAIGNGQDPRVARLAWKTLTEGMYIT